MTQTINSVEDYLKFMVRARKDLVSLDSKYRYCCIEEFVLTHGRRFKNVISRPSWVNKGVIKECFSNCLREVIRHPERLVYCEGYATGVIPTHHAWLMYEGNVIDPTWDGRDIIKENSEYFGIPLKYSYVMKIAAETGYYGVLDNFTQNYPLLREEHKEFLHESC